MKGKQDQTESDTSADLRKRTKRAVRDQSTELDELSGEDVRRLVHELRAHQAELEMQNAELRRTQQELEASRDRYIELYNFAPVGYLTIGKQGAILEVNLAGASLLGMHRNDLIGQSLSRFIAPDDQDVFYQHRKRVIETGITQNCEIGMVRRDSISFCAYLESAAVQNSVLSDVEKDPGQYRVTISDVTERVQAEEERRKALAESLQVEQALRESEKMYRTLMRVSPDAVTVNNPEGYFIGASQRAVELFGFENEQELLGTRVPQVIAPQDRARAIVDVQAIVEQGSAENLEYVLLRKDGTRFISEVSGALVKDEHGKPKAVIAIMRDVTERKRAEAALRRRNRDLELLNRAGRVFNSTLDLDQMLDAAMEELCSLLGVAACSVWLKARDSELVCRQAAGSHNKIVRGWRLTMEVGIAGWVARHGQALNVPDTRLDERHYKEIDRLTKMELRSILSIPLRVQEKEIGVLQVGDTAVGRFDAADLALVESLAATAAIAIENGRLYEQARQNAETKAMLLHEVNHRVKNNLTSIIGLLHAEQRHAETQDQATYHSVLQELSNRIQGLGHVHNMLSDVEWAPLSLDELTGQIIRMALQVLPRHKQVWIDVTPSPVRVSPRQANDLALIINELTTNTVKYALAERDTGDITVRITLTDDEESENEDDIVLLEFRDDGPGYPQQVLALETYNVGLHLVKMLTQYNLRGELTLRNDDGAVTAIRFKRRRPLERRRPGSDGQGSRRQV